MKTKKFLRIRDWVIPPSFQKIGLNIWDCIAKKSAEKKNFNVLLKNNAFRDIHHGKRCFVIGNGPSINYQDLTLLKSEITFVTNGFMKNNIIEHWQPNYYFFADPIFFDNSNVMNTFFSDLRTKIRDSSFFVPINALKTIETNNLLPIEKTNYFLSWNSLASGAIGKPDFTKAIPGVQSVTQLAIMAAMYMGCSPIFLIGFDHDWLSCPPKNSGRSYQHFYTDQTIDDYAKTKNVHLFDYKTDLINILNLWSGYENLLGIAEENDIKIINASNGGYLDVFPRTDYKGIF